MPRFVALHREDDTEFGFAAHHSGVGFGGFFQGIFFNHRPNAGQFGEAQRVF